MISPRAARLVASIHKWLGLIVGAQLIVWTATGLFFASFHITDVRGEKLIHPPSHAEKIDLSRVKLSTMDALKAVAEDRPAEVILKPLAGDPVYEVRADIGVFVISAETGSVLSPLSEELARKVASAAWAGDGAIQSMELLETAPHESGLTGQVWAAHFAGDGHPTLYVTAGNGQTSLPRTDLWRTYDFLWSLHIMDWGPARENFNTPWLVAAAILALSTVLFGVVLLVHRFTRGVLREKKGDALMHWTGILALIACVIGGGLGGYALINPRWASKLVRLVPAEGRIEGISEFRATYGGLFFLPHAFAFWAILAAQPGAEFAAAALGVAWLGSGFGRMVSIALDKTGSGLNWFNVAFEAVLGLMLLSPLLLS